MKAPKPNDVAQKRQARPAPPITSAWLERVALNYLDRYSASAAMLLRMLARRVERRCRARGEEADGFAGEIEATVARAVQAGLVDDARFATARLAGLRRRGTSTRGAGARLAAKGVPREVVATVLAEEGSVSGCDAEAASADAYAKRRRLGPYRRPDLREANRERDLAALARAGFPYPVAAAVIDRRDE